MKNLFLTAVLSLSVAISSFAQSGQLTETISWELEKGTLIINGEGQMPEFESPNDFPWADNRSSITEAVVFYDIENISAGAFRDCVNLSSVMLLCREITSIGEEAFLNCSSLNSIQMNSLIPPVIFENTFQGVDRSIQLSVPSASIELYRAALYWSEFSFLHTISNGVANGTTGDLAWDLADGTLTISGEGIMPDYYYSNPGWIIYGSSIAEIIIEEGVTSTGAYAFSGFENLISVTLPNTLDTIGVKSFASCFRLESIVIPNGVVSIGGAAFSNCENLSSISIPNSVMSIEYDAFLNCTNLSSIIMEGELPPIIIENTFRGVDHSITVIVPNETALDLYSKAPYWSEFTALRSATGVTSIDKIEDSKGIYTENGCIILDSFSDEITVRDVGGRIIVKGYFETIKVPQAGVYFVQKGNKVLKVLVP